MRKYVRIATAALMAAGLAVGCASSSHKSVRTYEYDEKPPPEQKQPEVGSSQGEMVSPGEMVGPGEMVDE